MSTSKAEAVKWAWLAGIFEGEGCIRFRGRSSVALSVTMTDFDVIRKCHELSGRGYLNGPYRPYGSTKQTLHWTVGQAVDVEFVLNKMLPHFGERRHARALEALERLALVDRYVGRRLHVGSICKNGHLISEDILYFTSSGYAGCSECRRTSRNKKVPA